MAIVGPSAGSGGPLAFRTLQGLQHADGDYYGLYETVVIPTIRFFVTYLNPRNLLTVDRLLYKDVSNFKTFCRRKLVEGVWSNEFISYATEAGQLPHTQWPNTNGLQYEFALYADRLWPEMYRAIDTNAWCTLDWQKSETVLIDNQRYRAYEDPLPNVTAAGTSAF